MFGNTNSGKHSGNPSNRKYQQSPKFCVSPEAGVTTAQKLVQEMLLSQKNYLGLFGKQSFLSYFQVCQRFYQIHQALSKTTKNQNQSCNQLTENHESTPQESILTQPNSHIFRAVGKLSSFLLFYSSSSFLSVFLRLLRPSFMARFISHFQVCKRGKREREKERERERKEGNRN